MLEIILQHLSWYPLMEIRDVYKLLFQGVMGSEHLISSLQDFIDYLTEEMLPLQADPTGRLLEPLRPDGSLLRINLRPFKARRIAPQVLIPLLLETARTIAGDRAELRAAWMDLIQACEGGRISNFEDHVVRQFTARLEELDFPAVHHSETYVRAYQPAYRLISARFIPHLGLADAG